MTGDIEVVDRQFNFIRAILPYDYRYTCNAQQWNEAERICAALEGPMISGGEAHAFGETPPIITERDVIAEFLGRDTYGFGRRIRLSARLLVADAIVRALSAAGYAITPKLLDPQLLADAHGECGAGEK